MSALYGSSFGVWLGLNVFVFGVAACLTGQTLAVNWKPAWQVAFWSAILAAFCRFLVYGLFDGDLLSLSGYAISFVTLLSISVVAYCFNRARRMVRQYPWLYERTGPFTWRERPGTAIGVNHDRRVT